MVDNTKNGKIFIELGKFKYNARLAQLVEHITDTDGVLGSNPRSRTKIKPALAGFIVRDQKAPGELLLGFERRSGTHSLRMGARR